MITNEEKEILENYVNKLINVPVYNLYSMEAVRIANEVNEQLNRTKEYVKLALLQKTKIYR